MAYPTPALRPYVPNFTFPENPPPETPSAPKLRTTAAQIGEAVKGAAKRAAPIAADAAVASAGGAALAAGVNALRQRTLDASTPAPPSADPSGIPGADPRYRAPPAAAGSLLNQSELGRNLGNIVNAIPALRTPVGAFTRAAAATNTLRLATPAALAVAGARGYAAGDAAFPGTAPAPAAPIAPAVSPSTRQPFSDARYGTYNAPDNAPNLEGKIVRDGNSYSGTNVKFGADVVDPTGKVLRGGTVSSFDTSEGHRQNLLELQRNAAERAAAPASAGPIGLGSSTGLRLDDTVAANKPTTRAERIAQAQVAAQREGQALSADTSRYTSDQSAQTSLRNADLVARTARRGQDMDYAEKIDAKRMDMEARRYERQLRGDIWKQANGNVMVAAQLAAAHGFDPNQFIAIDTAQRAGAKASAEGVDRVVAPNSLGPDNKISDGLVARNRALAESIVPGISGMSAADQAAAAPTVNSAINVVNSHNRLREDTLSKKLGFTKPDPEATEIPNYAGASVARLGPLARLNFTHSAKPGDYEITHRDGRKTYLGGDLTAHDLALVERRGLRIP